MRPIPRGTLFLLGSVLLKCSVFPDHAPAVGSMTGGSGGTPAAGANGGADAATNGGSTATGGAGGSGGASEGGGLDGGGRSAGAGDSGTRDADATSDGSVLTVRYVASVADCLEAVLQPQQGACLSYTTSTDGPNELWVDIRRAQHRAFTTYLLFPVDKVIAGRVVDGVELRITVTNWMYAAGAGADVWEVVPFTAQTLYTQTPAQLRSLATTPGSASKGQTVTYSLPVDAVKPSTSLSLSLTSPLNGDGTGYWGTNGDPTIQTPPTLVITYH